MADLNTSYLGLKCPNPLVLAASGLSSNADGLKKAAEAGAGAIVLKSLFEEQLRQSRTTSPRAPAPVPIRKPSLLENMGGHGGTGEYLELIERPNGLQGSRDRQRQLRVPERWIDFASRSRPPAPTRWNSTRHTYPSLQTMIPGASRTWRSTS
jgi:dihydroorotate dehydrogenase (fumarate)